MNQVILGNCCDVVPELGKFDFVFSDPPFNIGHQYSGYDDNLDDNIYEQFTKNWMSICWEACSGVMAIHGNDYLVELYLKYARELGMPRIAWVNWHFRFGECQRSNWINARCHCLIFSKTKTWTWNPDAVLIESDRVKYRDRRIGDYIRGGKRLPGTVWGVEGDGRYWGRVQGQNKERRRSCPNQLPEVYLARLIRAYTNSGDRVLDPFGGSGTTAVVCQALNRNFVTIDISQINVAEINSRLQQGAVRI